MFLIKKIKEYYKNKEKSKRKKIYLQNIKDASLFLDKSILIISSAFLGFIFSQLESIRNIERLININYLKYSIILIGLTIFFVLLSYVATIDLSTFSKDVDAKKQKTFYFFLKTKARIKFNGINFIITISRFIYIITIIFAIIFTILFYINNLK